MKFVRELYDSNFNYVKRYSFTMRYLNELILNGGVNSVIYLLYIYWYRSGFMFEGISDTFGTWTRGTCMCDSGVENN